MDVREEAEYLIKIKHPNPKWPRRIITQYGGPDGELAASLLFEPEVSFWSHPRRGRRSTTSVMEEPAHLEMVGSGGMVVSTEKVSIDQIKAAGMDAYYADHDKAVYPVSAAGVLFTAAYIQSKGDPVTDLTEDMAANRRRGPPMSGSSTCGRPGRHRAAQVPEGTRSRTFPEALARPW